MKTPDIWIAGGAPVYLLRGKTAIGREWIEENIQEEGVPFWCGSIVVEPRYMKAIVEGMLESGLTVSWDGRYIESIKPIFSGVE